MNVNQDILSNINTGFYLVLDTQEVQDLWEKVRFVQYLK